mgnify:CR=1 FL=1
MTSAIEPYYYSRGDGRYESTVHAQGAWNPHEQHMAPVSGILAHSLELFRPRGYVQPYKDGLFSPPSWISVFNGQGLSPLGHDRMAEAAPLALS